jgi:hypothetical protein
MELVTIKKTGQPTLRILLSALAQHVKLGWRHVEDEVAAVVEKVEAAVAKVEPAKVPKADTLKLKA